MRILALDAAGDRAAIGLIDGDDTPIVRMGDGTRGEAARLADLVDAALATAGCTPADLDLVAVTVGPGSFTGLRAALALAQGIGDARAIPVIGVTVGEAIAAAMTGGPDNRSRSLWVATDSRRGRLFLERMPGTPAALTGVFDETDLPLPSGPVDAAGDAAAQLAARLAARGTDVRLTAGRHATPAGIAQAAAARHAGRLPPRPTLPLYIDPPEARPPAGGLRPPPHP